MAATEKTENALTGIAASVTASGIVTVTTKIGNVTGTVTEIAIATATVTGKKNVGNTEAGHAKKTVNKKTVNQKTVNQKTVNQKTVTKKTVNKKTVSQKTATVTAIVTGERLVMQSLI